MNKYRENTEERPRIATGENGGSRDERGSRKGWEKCYCVLPTHSTLCLPPCLFPWNSLSWLVCLSGHMCGLTAGEPVTTYDQKLSWCESARAARRARKEILVAF